MRAGARSCSPRRRGVRSVDVAPVTPLFAQLFDTLVAQHVAQDRIHTGSEPVEAAADVNGRTGLHPSQQLVGRLAQSLLHVDAFHLVARPGEVGAFDPALRDPAFDVLAIEEVMRRLAFAEQQSVASMAGRHARLQQRAQRRQSGAIADQQ